jgi:hypothetical protein
MPARREQEQILLSGFLFLWGTQNRNLSWLSVSPFWKSRCGAWAVHRAKVKVFRGTPWRRRGKWRYSSVAGQPLVSTVYWTGVWMGQRCLPEVWGKRQVIYFCRNSNPGSFFLSPRHCIDSSYIRFTHTGFRSEPKLCTQSTVTWQLQNTPVREQGVTVFIIYCR